MRGLILSTVLIVTVGCGGRAADGDDPNVGQGAAKLERCDNVGDFDMSVTWAGVGTPLDGAKATFITTRDVGRKIGDVYVERTIQGGRLEVRCQKALVKDFRYPGLLLHIDADGDGRCSAGDHWGVETFYGWDAFPDRPSFEHTIRGLSGSAPLGATDGCALLDEARRAAESAAAAP